MTPAKGLAVQLAASEPLVRQPVTIDFDDRGRMWTIQYLQYPNPAGLKRAVVDRFSRTTYDRVPEPPPRGPKGADRVTILLDDDGDGRADRSKDFVSGLNLASGLAIGRGGVFVLQVPYLLFYPDRNADDVPDGDPEVLLKGFGMEDAHSVANSLMWGPDGWLYGCQGSTVTAKIRGIEFQQGVWRYHPQTKRFELFCEGGGNSWGLDFDRQGELFYSTNQSAVIALHAVQGAYYWKSFGKHGALHNPFAYGYFEHVPHEHFVGGHVTVGGSFNFADALGPAFRDKYLGADLLGHAAYWHTVHPRGSTYRSAHGGVLLASNDTWFAPSDLTLGPDGAVYVADWNDKRTAHPDPNADWDRSNGRIYRIAARGFGPQPRKNLPAMSTGELLTMLGNSNQWLVRHARRILGERRDPTAIEPLRKLLLDGSDRQMNLESLWTLYGCGGFDAKLASQLLDHPSADVRRWTVRLLGDEQYLAPEIAARFARLAASDPSVHVRTQLACTAKRLTASQSLPIIKELLAHAADADDPYQPLLLWWAVERHAMTSMPELVAMLARPEVWRQPLARDAVSPRLVRRYATAGSTEAYDACARLIESAPAGKGRDTLLAALDLGLVEQAGSIDRGGSAGGLFLNFDVAKRNSGSAGSKVRRISEPLAKVLDDLWATGSQSTPLVCVLARLGDVAAQREALAGATDPKRPVEERQTMVALLGSVSAEFAAGPLVDLAASKAPDPLKVSALEAIERFESPKIAHDLVGRYGQLTPGMRSRLADVMLGRKEWARILLDAVDHKQIPPADISLAQLRRVALHDDKQLDQLTRKIWGKIKSGTPEEKLNEMRRFNNDLRASQGDTHEGREIFRHKCATCHQLYGEGKLVGPELTHANRKDRDFLLASVIDPSAVVRKEFMNYVVETTGGRVLTGLVVEQTPGKVTLLGPNAERTTLDRNEIESIEESSTSLMPENLLSDMRPDQLRALFSYLQTERPLAGPSPINPGPK